MNPLIDLITDISVILKKEQKLLVTAESCTGGLISSSITDIAGSSAWFERGFVTYSNVSKHEMLGVPIALIEQYGAVSEEVAYAMATGALKHSKGSVAVAVTGIAGPDGGSVAKPVGTVCFGWAIKGKATDVLRVQLSGSRQDIRMAACLHALVGVRDRID